MKYQGMWAMANQPDMENQMYMGGGKSDDSKKKRRRRSRSRSHEKRKKDKYKKHRSRSRSHGRDRENSMSMGNNSRFKPSKGDWKCPKSNCRNWNFAKREKCNQCGVQRPPDEEGHNEDSHDDHRSRDRDNRRDSRRDDDNNRHRSSRNNDRERSTLKNPPKYKEGDWICRKCGNVNFGWRQNCNICKDKKVIFDTDRNNGVNQRYAEKRTRHQNNDNRSSNRYSKIFLQKTFFLYKKLGNNNGSNRRDNRSDKNDEEKNTKKDRGEHYSRRSNSYNLNDNDQLENNNDFNTKGHNKNDENFMDNSDNIDKNDNEELLEEVDNLQPSRKDTKEAELLNDMEEDKIQREAFHETYNNETIPQEGIEGEEICRDNEVWGNADAEDRYQQNAFEEVDGKKFEDQGCDRKAEDCEDQDLTGLGDDVLGMDKGSGVGDLEEKDLPEKFGGGGQNDDGVGLERDEE